MQTIRQPFTLVMAMLQVEGKLCCGEVQLAGGEAARDEWSFYDTEENRLSSEPTGISIYGQGGWNRYFVRKSGEVMFSQRHAMDEKDIEKAKAAGFTIAS